MKKKQKPEVRALGIGAVCFGIAFIAELIVYFMEPDGGGLVSTLCFGAAALCLAAGWYSMSRKGKD